MEPVVVIDVETTGISPDLGERATEIAALRVHEGRIVERDQSLMHPGRRIPSSSSSPGSPMPWSVRPRQRHK